MTPHQAPEFTLIPTERVPTLARRPAGLRLVPWPLIYLGPVRLILDTLFALLEYKTHTNPIICMPGPQLAPPNPPATLAPSLLYFRFSLYPPLAPFVPEKTASQHSSHDHHNQYRNQNFSGWVSPCIRTWCATSGTKLIFVPTRRVCLPWPALTRPQLYTRPPEVVANTHVFDRLMPAGGVPCPRLD